MRVKFSALAFLVLAAVTCHPPLLLAQGGATPPYGEGYFQSLNNSTTYPCGIGAPGVTQTTQIQGAFQQTAFSGGGATDLTCYPGPITITQDIFSPISANIIIWGGEHAITVNANATIPSNFEICFGPGGSIAAGVGFTLTNHASSCLGGSTGPGTCANALNTEGEILYYHDGACAALPIGTSAEVLTVVTGDPAWEPPSSGGSACGGTVQAGTICAGPPPLDGERSANVIQSNSGTTQPIPPASTIPAGTTTSVPYLQNVSAGDTLSVIVIETAVPAPADTFTVTDTEGNVYTQVSSLINNWDQGVIFTATAGSTGADTVNVVNGSANAVAISVYPGEYANLGTFEQGADNGGQPNTGPGFLVSSITTTHANDTIIGAIAGQSASTSFVLSLISAGWTQLPYIQNLTPGPNSVCCFIGGQISAFAPTATTYSTNVFSNNLTGLNAWQAAFFWSFEPLSNNFDTGPMIPRIVPPSGLLPTSYFATLGTPADADVVYCIDCDAPPQPFATCTSSGAKQGAEAHRINDSWQCVDGEGSGGSGTINAASQYSVPYYSAAGTATTLSGASNGLTGQVFTATNGAAPSFISPGVPGSTITTGTYTVACDSSTAIQDRLTTLRLASGASAVTVPDPSTSGCGSNFAFGLMNDGAGSVTISRGTSAVFNIVNGSTNSDAQTSFTLTTGQFAMVSSPDNTDWNVQITTGGGSGGSPGGSPTQMQYNLAGAFAGVSGSAVDSSGNVTLAPIAVTAAAALTVAAPLGEDAIYIFTGGDEGDAALYINSNGAGTANIPSAGILVITEINDNTGAAPNDIGLQIINNLFGTDATGSTYSIQAEPQYFYTGGTPVELTSIFIASVGAGSTGAGTLSAIHVQDQDSTGTPATMNAAILGDSQTAGTNVYFIQSSAGPSLLGDIFSPGTLTLADGTSETASYGEGYEFNCSDCDTPTVAGAVCTNVADHAGARAIYIRGTVNCY